MRNECNPTEEKPHQQKDTATNHPDKGKLQKPIWP